MLKESFDVVKVVLRERFSWVICEQSGVIEVPRSSQNRVPQRFEEQNVGRERISECRVETVCRCASRANGGGVPVSVRHGEVSQVSEEMFVSGCTPTGLSFHELVRLLLQFQKDTVAAGGGVTRKAVTGSQSSETKFVFLRPNVVFLGGGRGLSPQTFARQRLHPEYRQSPLLLETFNNPYRLLVSFMRIWTTNLFPNLLDVQDTNSNFSQQS